ncbi:uncharacterized protein LOC117945737 isoform X4 [Etheostoma cragini]|uniref:uncharacterized protein LOC117945737 isoform X4 n=1 Tax=Etheostoma cragini TaxID=417921 RepID=UPI00155EA4E9|nr:uncharacterized protein LOC117945737 isoform X4 [Etheostoma cragini]
MSRRRCIRQCKEKSPLFHLPKDDELKIHWLKFIFDTIPRDYSPNLMLCSVHFTDDCFLNGPQFNLGFSKRLILKDRAVPTLFGQPGDSEPQPGIREEKGSMTTVQDQRVKSEPDDLVISETALLTPPATTEDVKAECASELGLNEGGSILTVLSVESKPGTANSSCRIFPPVRHVASQTDPPKIKSIGTQLSMQTLQNPFRSKATQVKMPGRDCGVCTDTFPLDSPLLLLQPTLVKRPSKRPRLSLTDEEEGPSESSLSVVVHEPEDST